MADYARALEDARHPVRARRRRRLRRVGGARGLSDGPLGARRSRQSGAAARRPPRPALRNRRRGALPIRARGRTASRSGPSLPLGADPRTRRAFGLFRVGGELRSRRCLRPPRSRASRRSSAGSALAAARPLGDSRAGNLLKALAAARRALGRGTRLPGASRASSNRLRDESWIEQMSVEPGRPDAVRLLTLHGAKGLEAPVVFLAEPAYRARSRSRQLWIDRTSDPPPGLLPRRPALRRPRRRRDRAAAGLGPDGGPREGVRERGGHAAALRRRDAGEGDARRQREDGEGREGRAARGRGWPGRRRPSSLNGRPRRLRRPPPRRRARSPRN